MNKQLGFTLAETLITLVIIGIVAALTVPSMIARYQEQQRNTKLKKIYSTLLQMNYKAIADNGPMYTWRFNNSKDFIDKYMRPYLNIAKDCKPYPSKECGRYGDMDTVNPHFILNDGMILDVQAYPTKDKDVCPAQTFVCGGVAVLADLNGEHKPNKYNNDVFRLEYTIFSNKFIIDSAVGRDVIKNK